MFNESTSRNQMHYAYRIYLDYQSVIFTNSSKVLDVFLTSLESSPYQMDLKLQFLMAFLPKIKYKHVDRLINILSTYVDNCKTSSSILVSNVNPFSVTFTALQIFDRIKKDFPLSRLRVMPHEESV